ncbi:MAG: methyltransferase domain-containing protein [Pseudomonadota bacterium]|nr:methyltransferase domain-containing protein [Pseudomonadota bacterium]
MKKYSDLKAEAIELLEQKNFDKALELISAAIEIEPKDVDTLFSQGLIFQKLGRNDQAIQSYKKSLSIKPSFRSLNNISALYWSIGKRKEAILALEEAMRIEPNDMGIANLAMMYFKSDLYVKSLECSSIVINTEASSVKFHSAGKIFCDSLNKLQDKDYPNDSSQILSALSKLLFSNSHLPATQMDFLKFIFKDFDKDSLPNNLKKENNIIWNEEFISILIDDYPEILTNRNFLTKMSSSVIGQFLKTNLVMSRHSENIYTKLRKFILENYKFFEGDSKSNIINIASYINIQCEYNGFIWNVSEQEKKILRDLIHSISLSIENNREPNILEIIIMGCYYPYKEEEKIYKWLIKNKDSFPDSLKEVIVAQIEESFEISEISPLIKRFGEITDAVSKKVKGQYENYPYPRWKGRLEINTQEQSVTLGYSSKYLENKIAFDNEYEILVAGCGTGQEAVQLASLFSNSRIVAVDLSLPSLCYAKKKMHESSITNIEFLQSDILNLGNFNKKFDIITSCGVLHHLDKPEEGLNVLKKLLKQDGVIKLALYSSLARKEILSLQNKIKEFGYGNSISDIRRIRNLIKSNDKRLLGTEFVQRSQDFYSAYGIRDLLFHPREVNYNLIEVLDLLDKVALEFIEFDNQYQSYKDFYKTKYPKDLNISNLKNWQELEKENPTMFAKMYVFWAKSLH